jgi:hypothetical protein
MNLHANKENMFSGIGNNGGFNGDYADQTHQIKGYEQVTNRMRKGREERERTRLMQARGVPGTIVDEGLLQPL